MREKTLLMTDKPDGNAEYVLSVRNLCTYYYKISGIVKAVDHVSFDIKPGEMVAIVGESGCGKTAVALSILDLIPNPPGKITDGEILFGSRNLRTLSAEALRQIRGKDIGMVFQEPMASLNPVLTIGRQLSEGIIEHLHVTRTQATTRACELLRKVGIANPESRLNQYPFQLSGGMRQRVMIAIALSCNPKLIIADEPTTALDVTVQAQILELMKKLCSDLNVSFLVITHNLGIVARYANHVNVMYAGRIIEKGTTNDVFCNPLHPYTKALMEAIPRLDLPAKERLDAICGQPPDLSDLPKGCAFRPRCMSAQDICAEEYPHFVDMGCNHLALCWLLKR